MRGIEMTEEHPLETLSIVIPFFNEVNSPNRR